MRIRLICFATVVVLTLLVYANVSAVSVSQKLGAILPYTGMYYDPNQAGSGLSVDFGPGGLMFLQFATYDANGNQVNYIVQPQWQPSDEATLVATGFIGTANAGSNPAPFFQATNGQCPGCPYRAQTETDTPIIPSFSWTRPRHVDMSFALSGTTHTYHFDAANYESKDDEEFLPGTWALCFVNDNSVYPGEGPEYQITLPTELAIMHIAPAPFTMAQMTLDPASSPDVKLPPADANLYTLFCAGNQMGADDTACFSTEMIWNNAIPGSRHNPIPLGTAKAVVWYDPATATAGMDIYQAGAGGKVIVGPADFHGEVYISPNTLQVHLQAQGPAGVSAATDGIEGIAMTFTRLPASAVRDCYDYPSSSTCQ